MVGQLRRTCRGLCKVCDQRHHTAILYNQYIKTRPFASTALLPHTDTQRRSLAGKLDFSFNLFSAPLRLTRLSVVSTDYDENVRTTANQRGHTTTQGDTSPKSPHGDTHTARVRPFPAKRHYPALPACQPPLDSTLELTHKHPHQHIVSHLTFL